MEIKVRLQLLNSDDGNGVKLWAEALDGSNRAWYRWYENRSIAMMNAETMELVETPVTVTLSEDRLYSGKQLKLLAGAKMREGALETHWNEAAKPNASDV